MVKQLRYQIIVINCKNGMFKRGSKEERDEDEVTAAIDARGLSKLYNGKIRALDGSI